MLKFGMKKAPEPESDSDWDSIVEPDDRETESRLNESLASLADLKPSLNSKNDSSLGNLQISMDPGDDESIQSVLKSEKEEKKKPVGTLKLQTSPKPAKNHKVKKTDSQKKSNHKRKSSPPKHSDDDLQITASHASDPQIRSKNLKNEFPPPDFQSAITDDDPPSVYEAEKPSGVSRKGSLYDVKATPGPSQEISVIDPTGKSAKIYGGSGSGDPNNDGRRSVYYFNHPTIDYVVSESRHNVFMERIAEKAEDIFIRIFREFFGGLRILMSFIILFIVELWRFLVLAIIRPLILGVIVSIGENFVKPLLAGLYNGIIHPLFVLLHSICQSIKTSLAPVVNCFVSATVTIFKSFRLCEIHRRQNDKCLDV